MNIIKIGIVDDQILFRDLLAKELNTYGDLQVVICASNGVEMTDQLMSGNVPDLMLLDLNMPKQDGFDAARHLHTFFPKIRILLLSIIDSDYIMLPLIRLGVNGFLHKNINPKELHKAIITTINEGFYYSRSSTSKLMNLLQPGRGNLLVGVEKEFTEKERKFLQLASTEMTYKQIGDEMEMGFKQIDRMRDDLFVRADVKSRTALVLFAIKHGLINLPFN